MSMYLQYSKYRYGKKQKKKFFVVTFKSLKVKQELDLEHWKIYQ